MTYHLSIQRVGKHWSIIGVRRQIERTCRGFTVRTGGLWTAPEPPVEFGRYKTKLDAAYHLGALESRLAPARA